MFTVRPASGDAKILPLHPISIKTQVEKAEASTGNPVWRANFDPFGKAAVTLETQQLNLRFPGQYYDAETEFAGMSGSGTHYNVFRDYDPSTGRYLQSDPIGLAGGLNTYAYANNNPVRFSDPLGLKARVCCRLLPYVGSITRARHCYVERDTDWAKWGLIGDEGGPSSKSGTIFIGNQFDFGGDCGEWNDECGVDGCVETAANSYPNPSTYSFFRGPNSNTFAGTVVRKCNLKKPWGISPGWNDDPAPQFPGSSYQPPTDLRPSPIAPRQ